ncbi:hypothetical protein GIB67_021617 [Kingdonia uniflora]|uniref:hAT-like transposase RNase-H fold domain-containing protein n=1 Tax=Kingdonia uniflora TaxID=39325 RepID=A0A7J7MDX8_9MAGN|nr:hypothetical protein GIB67_021617 [Kingdonia uniflora]
MVIKHEYPFAKVEHEYFRTFVNNLQPQFKLISRNTLRTDVMAIYQQERQKLYKFLDKLQSRISCTTDLWSSEHTKDAYLCLTRHFVNNDWVLKKKILSFVKMECDHTGEDISKVVMNCLLDWNIEQKLTTITLDNATSNDTMIANLKMNLNRGNHLILGGKIFHVRCTAHIINLIVKDGLAVLGDTLSKIRDSCIYVKKTLQRKIKWKNAIDQVKIKSKRDICTDVSTRWNSTFLMIERALEFKEAFARLDQQEIGFKVNPTVEEWELAKDICNCLKVFYDSTKAISGTKYPTSNIYFSEVCEIHLCLMDWLQSPNITVQMMATSMLEKFKKYWSCCSLVLAVAVVLDSRFNIKFVHYYYNLIYHGEVNLHVEKVRIALEDIYKAYTKHSTSPLSTSHASSSGVCGNGGKRASSDVMNLDSSKSKRVKNWYLQEGLDCMANKSERNPYFHIMNCKY